MIDTFSGVTIYGSWDDWYSPKETEEDIYGVEDDDETIY